MITPEVTSEILEPNTLHIDDDSDTSEYSTTCLCFTKRSGPPSNVWSPEENTEKDGFISELEVTTSKHVDIINELVQNSALRAKYPNFSIKASKVNPLIKTYRNDCWKVAKRHKNNFGTSERDWYKLLFDRVRLANPKWGVFLKISKHIYSTDFTIEVLTQTIPQ